MGPVRRRQKPAHVPHRGQRDIIEPIDRIHIPERRDLHLVDRKVPTHLDEPIDIPGIEPIGSGPKVILLSYRHQISLSTDLGGSVSRDQGYAV